MEHKRVSGVIISLLLALAILQIHPALIVGAEEITEFEWFDLLDAVGNNFEITDSVYLNITLTSTETVHVVLESVPRTVSYIIESNSSATSTALTISGLESNADYYRYQDGLLMENFTANHYGEHTYTQDISKPHRVFVQENASTIYIGSNYTFTQNITEPIVVTASNIVIDGNGYSLKGPYSGPWYFGMYLPGRSGVTIKNLIIEDWSGYGIMADWSHSNEIRDNLFLNNSWEAGSAILLWESKYNLVTANTFQNNSLGIGLFASLDTSDLCTYNTISNNNLSSNSVGVGLVGYADHNTIINNTATTNVGGIVVQMGSDYNLVSGNNLSNNDYGIWLHVSVTENIITDNLISSNDYGIWTGSAYQNTIYHNNIIQNVNQAYSYLPDFTNYWHHPDLLEGNYWSDYPGVDDGSGTGKHAIAGDGIGDTNIPWPGPDYDYYPFTSQGDWLDTTPPEITIITPEPYGLYIVGVALDFYATDAESGVATIVGQLTNTAGDYQEVDSGFTPLQGVYTLVVVATDNRGNIAESDPVFFVVYDPEGGFATGGGWIYPDEESTLPGGKANFGFVAKYRHGSSTGNLEFQYNDADINLKSTTIDWLVISGVSAHFQGTGTINGEELYTFRVMTKDNGEPGVSSDEFNIRIWEGTDTEADPIHKAKNTIAGGNIVVHKK